MFTILLTMPILTPPPQQEGRSYEEREEGRGEGNWAARGGGQEVWAL